MSDPADTGEAVVVVRRVLGEEPVLTPEAGGLNAALPDANRAADVLIALRQSGLSIASATVQKPTLDEVFMAITGHGAEDETHDPARRPDEHHDDTTLLPSTRPPRSWTALSPPRPSLRDTVDQSLAMAWQALKKMRRNPSSGSTTVQPLLFTAMFAYIFGGAISGSVEDYLPTLITGIPAQTALTACMATGIQAAGQGRLRPVPSRRSRASPRLDRRSRTWSATASAATLLTIPTGRRDTTAGWWRPLAVAGWLLTIVAGWSLA